MLIWLNLKKSSSFLRTKRKSMSNMIKRKNKNYKISRKGQVSWELIKLEYLENKIKRSYISHVIQNLKKIIINFNIKK